jgi:hypothetical protein
MNARAALLLLLASGCGASSPAPVAPTPTSEPAPSASSPPALVPHPAAVEPASDAAAPASDAPAATPSTESAELPTGSVLVGEIASAKKFDPNAAVNDHVSDFATCYRRARVSVPGLHGKLNLSVVVGESGKVQSVAPESGGSANDPTLVACLGEAFKTVRFPKPGGTAIVLVPLLFRP